MKKLTCGSVFSGIGGSDLAATWAGWETVFHCEINPFCTQILKYYWPHAQTHTDITTTDFTVYRGKIDVLCGGFPCQPNSVAGKRLGTDDDRYLWPEMRRAYKESQPRIIVAENVTGILSVEDKTGIWKEIFPKVESRKITRYSDCDHYEAIFSRQSKMLINTICENLEEDGYEAIPVVIPAGSIGAPHRRDRVWIFGYSKHDGSYGAEGRGKVAQPSVQTGKDEIWKSKRTDGLRTGDDADSNPIHADTSGYDTGEITQQQTTEIRRNRSGQDATNTNSDDAGRRGHGETGRKESQSKKEGEEREWFWPLSERIGTEGDATDSGGEQLQGSEFDGGTGGERTFEGQGGQFSRPVCDPWQNFPTVSPLYSGDDVLSGRLDSITVSKWRTESIKGLGNAWCPYLALQFFDMINQIENERLYNG